MAVKIQPRQTESRFLTRSLLAASALSFLLLFAYGASHKERYRVATTGAPVALEEPATSQMVFIKGGCFLMGSPEGEEDVGAPEHEVCVDDYYMQRYEVSMGEFGEFVQATGYTTDAEKGNGCYHRGSDSPSPDGGRNWENPGFPPSESHPVVCVSWNDAVLYAAWKSQVDGRNYRLPTEAEWEYAARSRGLINKWSGTNLASELDYYVWYEKNSSGRPHPVGKKRANGLGLYDMSGNVREWVSDWYQDDYYVESRRHNPPGPESGTQRVARGGSWSSDEHGIRVAHRQGLSPSEVDTTVGFRIARTP